MTNKAYIKFKWFIYLTNCPTHIIVIASYVGFDAFSFKFTIHIYKSKAPSKNTRNFSLGALHV